MMTNDELFNSILKSGKLNDFLDLVDPKGFDEFSNSVFLTLRKATQSLEQHADKYYNQTEEQISATVSLLIEKSGFKTKSEPSNRGHIDIFVEKGGFEWLIEAKIGYNNHKIFEGLLQLTSRYLTNQRSACLLLYYKKENIKAEFENWKAFILGKQWKKYAENKSISDTCEMMYGTSVIKENEFCFGNSFLSSATTSAGESIDIYNLGVNLYFRPIDSSGRDSKSLKKEHAKLYLEHLYHDKDNGSEIDKKVLLEKLNDYFNFD